MDRWRTGASFGMFSSDLSFGDNLSFAILRRAVSVGAEYRVSPETTLGLGGGAGLGGFLAQGARRFDVQPGWLVTAAYSRRLVDGRGRKPFLLVSASFGASGASTLEEVRGAKTPASVGLFAFDLRLGVTVGKTFWNALSPYAAVRAFGGPVVWSYAGKGVTGTDENHYQIALGAVSSLPRGFDLYAEVAPLGERAVTVGGGKIF